MIAEDVHFAPADAEHALPDERSVELLLNIVLEAGGLERRAKTEPAFQFPTKSGCGQINLGLGRNVVEPAILTHMSLGEDKIARIDREAFIPECP